MEASIGPYSSQEKGKKTSFEACFLGEETEATQVVRQQIVAAFLTSAPTPRPLGPANSELPAN